MLEYCGVGMLFCGRVLLWFSMFLYEGHHKRSQRKIWSVACVIYHMTDVEGATFLTNYSLWHTLDFQTDSFRMGQEFVKNAPGSFDSLSDLDLNHDLLDLHSPERDQQIGLRSSCSQPGTGGRVSDTALLMGRRERDGLDQMLSAVSSSGPHLDMLHAKNITYGAGQRQSLQRESLCFMKGVMDECTHIANFSGTKSVLFWMWFGLCSCVWSSFLFSYFVFSACGSQSNHYSPGKGRRLYSPHWSSQLTGNLAWLWGSLPQWRSRQRLPFQTRTVSVSTVKF